MVFRNYSTVGVCLDESHETFFPGIFPLLWPSIRKLIPNRVLHSFPAILSIILHHGSITASGWSSPLSSQHALQHECQGVWQNESRTKQIQYWTWERNQRMDGRPNNKENLGQKKKNMTSIWVNCNTCPDRTQHNFWNVFCPHMTIVV